LVSLAGSVLASKWIFQHPAKALTAKAPKRKAVWQKDEAAIRDPGGGFAFAANHDPGPPVPHA
jgi:hypothetical protein